MRILTDSIGAVFFVVGLMFLVGSYALRGHSAGSLSFWLGAALLARFERDAAKSATPLKRNVNSHEYPGNRSV